MQNGAYANLTFVSHTETEFVFDYVYVLPHEPRGVVRSRVITSAKQAKRLLARAEQSCLITNSLKGAVHLEAEVEAGAG